MPNKELFRPDGRGKHPLNDRRAQMFTPVVITTGNVLPHKFPAYEKYKSWIKNIII